MKKKILMLFVFLATASLAFVPVGRAVASFSVYAYADKVSYKPGDSGTLQIWIYNSGDEDLILKNITIYYPWYNPAGLWAGNVTIVPPTSTVIAAKGNWSGTSTFTIPNDGRVTTGGSTILINVVTDKVTESSSISMGLTSTPFYFSLQSMDQLLVWFTILIAAIVACTLIIVGTIFVSTRGLRTMMKP